ncbi:MAG: hypothetical protein CSA38_05125 [Flavobacteriales bacterium]|nr:MAG: hypothetical protein CSA38_05125 [Flavobacteriales bacterium]
MKKYLPFAFVFLFTFNCKKVNNDVNPTEVSISEEPPKPKDYRLFLNELGVEKLTAIEKRNLFFSFINQDIPNYWTGTKWDFNGNTRLPQQGKIACGYFITNTLSDFGLKINRIHLAQEPSSKMIKKLCNRKSIRRFADFNQLKKYLSNGLKQEIFIIGLDYHTGFIIKDENNFYFLHSNYIQKEGVVKEKIENSKALHASKSFMIGSLTQNTSLFE